MRMMKPVLGKSLCFCLHDLAVYEGAEGTPTITSADGGKANERRREVDYQCEHLYTLLQLLLKYG